MIQITSSAQTDRPTTAKPLQLARKLFDELNATSIRYCHWKSNESLAAALAGVGDLDLLVDRDHASHFEQIIGRLGFKLFEQPRWQRQEGIVQFFGHDPSTGSLLHLHVYYSLTTGGHLLKNYRLPLQRMLLDNCHLEMGVRVADRAAELAVFVLRKMLESGNLVEFALQQRDQAHVDCEWYWLLPEDVEQRATRLHDAFKLLADPLPQFDLETWIQSAGLLSMPGATWKRLRTGRRVRRILQGCAIRGRTRTAAATLGRLARIVTMRLLRQRSRKSPALGGKVVALVGPEASGKSTYCDSLHHWLGDVVICRAIHMGKPGESLTGRLGNMARRLRRRLGRRVANGVPSDASPEAGVAESHPISWTYAIASVVLAWDRYQLAVRAHRDAARGSVVICDRYPSKTLGAVDGPRLCLGETAAAPWWLKWAARWERRYYLRIPPADQIVELSVPVDIAQQRNRCRVKAGKEDDVYLAQRHVQFHAGRAEERDAQVVDTDAPMATVKQRLRTLIWKGL